MLKQENAKHILGTIVGVLSEWRHLREGQL